MIHIIKVRGESIHYKIHISGVETLYWHDIADKKNSFQLTKRKVKTHIQDIFHQEVWFQSRSDPKLHCYACPERSIIIQNKLYRQVWFELTSQNTHICQN